MNPISFVKIEEDHDKKWQQFIYKMFTFSKIYAYFLQFVGKMTFLDK